MRKLLRISSLMLAILLAVNSYAAVVSDNDGSAFITKSEFDSLKNDFQSQINAYNTSIDSKIDEAIAAYLSGIRVSREYTLTLDPKCNYVFPLLYDSNQYWNNYYTNSSGYKLPYPEFHIEMWLQRYSGLIYPSNNTYSASWSGGTTSTGKISTGSSSWPTGADYSSGTQRYSAFVRYHFDYDYNGKDGLLNMVKRLSTTRKIDGKNYNIYEIENEGIGKFVHSYDTDYQFSAQGGTMYGDSGAATPHTTGASMFLGVDRYQYSYTNHKTTNCRYVIQEPSSRTSSQPVEKLTKSSGKGAGPQWVNQADTSGLYGKSTSTKYTCTQIGAKEFTSAAMDAQYTAKTVWSAAPMAEASKYTTPNTRRFVFSRKMFMPANQNYDYALTADLQRGTSTQYEICGGGTGTLDEGKIWGTLARTIFVKPMNKMLCVPPFKAYTWHSSTKYAPGASEAFSYLPATLVSYIDSNGKRHYMDEGMYMGKMPKDGYVSFKVRFTRYYGSGTLVRFRLSKKPFSYDFADKDLLKYTVGTSTTQSTNSTLNYSTTYTVKLVDELKEGDELYMEWQQVTTADLPQLASLTDFKLISDQ